MGVFFPRRPVMAISVAAALLVLAMAGLSGYRYLFQGYPGHEALGEALMGLASGAVMWLCAWPGSVAVRRLFPHLAQTGPDTPPDTPPE